MIPSQGHPCQDTHLRSVLFLALEEWTFRSKGAAKATDIVMVSGRSLSLWPGEQQRKTATVKMVSDLASYRSYFIKIKYSYFYEGIGAPRSCKGKHSLIQAYVVSIGIVLFAENKDLTV